MAVTQAYYKDENRDVGNEAVVAGVNASAGNEAEVTIDRTQLDVNKRETNILGQAVESNEEEAHVKAARLAQEAKRRAERNVFNKTEERHREHKCMRRFAYCCPCLKNWLLSKELVEGKTPLMRTMQAFEMTKRDSAKFLKLFEKIDWDHSGTIDIEELFGYLKMDVAGYARKTFSTMNVQHEYMDEDGRFDPRKFQAAEEARQARGKTAKRAVRGGKLEASQIELDYAPFFVGLFDFCTMNDEHLVRFTFDLIDEDRSGYLSREEVYDLILLMSKTEAEAQLKCQKLLNVIDANKDGDVSYVEFARCHRRIPSLMQPAFIIRRSLRMKCMGNKFWKRCCKIRTKLKKTKGREPLGVYKDILDQMARADQEVAEAEMLELEAAAAADQHLVDQAGDESDDLDMEELLDDVGMNEEKPKELTPEEIEARRKAALRAKLRGAQHLTRGTLAIAKAAGVDMHREGSWWSDCPKQRMKNLDDPEKNGNAKVYISIETADALSECKVTRDKAALIQAREFRTKEKLQKLEENAKKFGGFTVKGRKPTTPWGRLAYWWSERKKKQLAAKKIREERERAKYAAARQEEMDRRAVAKAKEKERMEAMMEARRRKKEEIAGLKTPGALSEGARAVSTPKAGAKRVGFAEAAD